MAPAGRFAGQGNFDDPRSLAADERRWAAFETICDLRPATIEGIAAQLRILWIERGPIFLPGTDMHTEEMSYPENRLMRSLLEGAEEMAAKG